MHSYDGRVGRVSILIINQPCQHLKWEETGVPGENPRLLAQKVLVKAWKALALTIAPPKSPPFHFQSKGRSSRGLLHNYDIQWNLHITDSLGPTFSVRCLEVSVAWRCPLFRGFYNRDFNYGREDPDMNLLSVVLRYPLFRMSVSRGSTVFKNLSNCFLTFIYAVVMNSLNRKCPNPYPILVVHQ